MSYDIKTFSNYLNCSIGAMRSHKFFIAAPVAAGDLNELKWRALDQWGRLADVPTLIETASEDLFASGRGIMSCGPSWALQ